MQELGVNLRMFGLPVRTIIPIGDISDHSLRGVRNDTHI